MPIDYIKSAREILDEILYLTLATVSDKGEPWNNPVAGAHDEDYNFYWGSHTESQHSKNIRANGKVTIVVYDSSVEAGNGRGVYIQAEARQLEDMDGIIAAHKILQNRYPKPFWPIEFLHGSAPVRLYKATSKRFWHNSSDVVNGHHVDKRKEIELL